MLKKNWKTWGTIFFFSLGLSFYYESTIPWWLETVLFAIGLWVVFTVIVAIWAWLTKVKTTFNKRSRHTAHTNVLPMCFFVPLEKYAPVEFAQWKEKHKWDSWGPKHFQQYYNEVDKYKYCEFARIAEAGLGLILILKRLNITTQEAHDELAVICEKVIIATANKNPVHWLLGLVTIATCITSAILAYSYNEGWSVLMFMFVGGLLLAYRGHMEKIWQPGINMFINLFILVCLYSFLFITITLKTRGL